MQSFGEIIAALFARRPENEIDIKLDRMHGVLQQLGSPQNACKVVHIAGTNGKTSTAKYISTMLQTLGFSVGRYSSPHLITPLERIELNSAPISEARFIEEYMRIIPIVERYEAEHPDHGKFGFFEVVTLIAYATFARDQVDFAIVEVGLGGRFDATNVSQNVALSVITPIGIDHTEFLGASVEGIAREKAGIVKPGVPVLLAAQTSAVQSVLDAEIADVGAKACYSESLPERLPDLGSTYLAQNFALAYSAVHILVQKKLSNEMQLGSASSEHARVQNARVGNLPTSTEASTTNELFTIDALQQLFCEITVPGRLQLIQRTSDGLEMGALEAMVDASHNPHGANALVSALQALGYTEIIAVVAQFEDKDSTGFLQALAPVVSEFIFTRNSSPRSRTPEGLYAVYADIAAAMPNSAPAQTAPTLAEALELATNSKLATAVNSPSKSAKVSSTEEKKPLLLITGSVVTAGDALQFFDSNPPPF